VKSECHFEFVCLDTSKPCDSRAMIMRKERRGGALPEGRAVLWPGCERWVSGMLLALRVVSRQCDEVKAMSVSGMIARACLAWPAFTT